VAVVVAVGHPWCSHLLAAVSARAADRLSASLLPKCCVQGGEEGALSIGESIVVGLIDDRSLSLAWGATTVLGHCCSEILVDILCRVERFEELAL